MPAEVIQGKFLFGGGTSKPNHGSVQIDFLNSDPLSKAPGCNGEQDNIAITVYNGLKSHVIWRPMRGLSETRREKMLLRYF